MTAGYSLTVYVATSLAGAFILCAVRLINARARSRLPPGPKPLPLLGNVLDMPLKEEWLTWQSYVKQYGDLVFLSALGRNFLLLGSHETIIDLIEKRVTFNSRPIFPMLHELMGFTWILAFMPYGDQWRQGRKLLHAHVHAGAAVNYEPIQLLSARRFVRDLLVSEKTRPADKLSDSAKAVLPRMVRANFALNAVRMIYGIDVRDSEAEARYVDVPEGVIRMGNEAGIPGRFLVDFFPILKHIPSWFPGANFQRFAEQTKALHQRMRNDPLTVTRSQMATGSAPVSIVASMLESDPDKEVVIKDLAGTAYIAGSDTTVAAITSFFLAAVVYPEVQKRAQEELNRVVGRDYLPDFKDKDSLPYLEAVMRESLRWLPVLPLGVAHATTEDEEYRGYLIPKDTIVFPFQWGLLHDTKVYPEPNVFSPERYLVRLPDGVWKLRTDVTDPRTFAFGFGRRVCQGIHIAEQSLFTTLATVIHTLDIVRAKDHVGKEIVPEVRTNSGLVCHPEPFEYELHLRSDAQKLFEMCIAAADESN